MDGRLGGSVSGEGRASVDRVPGSVLATSPWLPALKALDQDTAAGAGLGGGVGAARGDCT